MKTIYEQTPSQLELENKFLVSSLLKRTIEILFSLIGLFFLSPLWLMVCLIIKVDSPGPIFYRQERIGLNGRRFNILKFRSMYTDSEKNGPQWALKNDHRITTVGWFLRKYRIDEIPQLVNVLIGDMALVGPRPERPFFIEEFEKEIPGFRSRLAVKPGITGLAQVNGGYDLTPKEKLELDIFYIHNCSLRMDLKIIAKSIPVILLSKGWR